MKMKKISMILVFVTFAVMGFSQEKPFTGFLFPVKDNPIVVNTTIANRALKVADSTYNIRLIRFNMEVGGIQVLYNKVAKEIKTEAFLKVGIGLSYSFYKVTGAVPFNYLSINGFVFLPVTESNQTLSVAATVAAFRLFGTNLSPEIGINFEPDNIKSDYFPVSPLISLKYNF